MDGCVRYLHKDEDGGIAAFYDNARQLKGGKKENR
jgi:hypothetical protein